MVNGWPDGVTPPPTTDRLIGVGFIPGVPRLGVPALTFTDGPAGVRMNLPTTAMPAPVALAATFSADLAHRYGKVLGRDARARDQDVIFAPMLNLVRVPQAGRNFETLGEDPFLIEPAGHGRDQGDPGRGRDRHGEALRGEQPGEPAADDQRQRRRADAARDGAARLRSRGAAGPHRLGHVLVQLGQREVRLREPHAAHRHPAPPVGLHAASSSPTTGPTTAPARRCRPAWTSSSSAPTSTS